MFMGESKIVAFAKIESGGFVTLRITIDFECLFQQNN